MASDPRSAKASRAAAAVIASGSRGRLRRADASITGTLDVSTRLVACLAYDSLRRSIIPGTRVGLRLA
jgi:hypothetical protein